MKNKDFAKFSKRNTHKRRAKDKAKAELLSAIRQVEESYYGFKVKDSFDEGRRGRVSPSPFKGEKEGEGIFSSSKSGFGFVKLPDAERDIFIPEHKTKGAIDGDKVKIIYHSYKGYDGNERTEGRVTEIVCYGRKFIIGTLDEEIYRHGRRRYKKDIVIPDDQGLPFPFAVSETMGAEVGDKVVCELQRRSFEPECKVTKILGHTESREANYEAILIDEGIDTEFSDEEIEFANEASMLEVCEAGRFIPDGFILTMDSEGAKDLDDAVSLEKTEGGYLLGVHIADVAHYVKERTVLDRCVMARGTSVYFTDKVVPMLPTSLSNGACSLNAGEKKYTLSAMIRLTDEGEIEGCEIYESVIVSRIRGIYSEINRVLEGESGELAEKYKEAIPTLKLMRTLYEKLLSKREKEGYIDFGNEEAEIVLDNDGSPMEIIPSDRGISERIIEHFMLTANEAVANLLHGRDIPCVYRIHELPPKDKLSDFVKYAANLGLDTREISKGEPEAAAFRRLLSDAEKKGVFEAASMTMLRAMSKAVYSADCKPHFGLGVECYCHFTSPIRRLSDLATHRIIKNAYINGKNPKSFASYARRAAAAATEGELRAESAERRIENLYKALYMAERLGEEFSAVVISVTQYGLFCRLENTCEGLIPLSELPGEFIFEEKTLTLRSRDASFKIADKLTVILEEVDLIRGKLRFSIT